MLGSLNSVATARRITGADRFGTSSNIASDAFATSGASQVFLATGYNFPDALAGAVLAGAMKAPLIVVPTDCVPPAVLLTLQKFGVTRVTLLGGTSALTANVANVRSC